jgi:hypothetical protein
MKKLNFFSAVFLVAGLITSSFVQGQSCDTLRNYTVPSNGQYTVWSGTGGVLLGQDELNTGTDTYQTDIWAEPYDIGTSSNQIRAIRMLPSNIQNNSGSASLTIEVYNEIAGEPGTIIGQQVVNYSDLNNEMVWSSVEFGTPVNVTGRFYVGYRLSFASPVDTFSLAGTQPATNFTMFHLDGPVGGAFTDTWQTVNPIYSSAPSVPINSAFALDVLLSTGTPPTANFTVSNSSVCLGGEFIVDGSTSTGDIDEYTWLLRDNPYTQNLVVIENGTVNDQISPSTATPSEQRLVLLVSGACSTTGVYTLVDVLPNVDATVTKVDDNCTTGSGSIAISGVSGGNGSYLYSIDGGTNTGPTGTFNGLSAGSYDVEVTTIGDGCSYTETVVVTDSPAEVITVGAAQTICSGSSATVTASGTGSIAWFNGATSVGTGTSISVSPTATTTYDATLTDANGCTDTKQITVTVTPQEDAGFTYASSTICLGSGSVTPTSIATAGGAFTASGTGLVIDASTGVINLATSTAGTYDVTYTTTGTCSDSETQQITVTASTDATFTYANTEYCQSEGTVTPTFPTGASAGTFSSTTGLTLTPGTGAINFTTSTAGAYTVTNTIAASGTCPVVTETFNVTVKDIPNVIAGTDQALCEGTDVTLTATGAATYSWDNSVTQATAFTPGIGTTVYTVTGTGANGCENTDQVTVVVTANPTVNAGADQAICEATQITLTAAISAGTVSWDNGITDGTAFTPTATGTYTVTVDDNGCTATDDVTVTVNPLPTVNAGSDQTACVDHSPIVMAGTPSGGSFSGDGISGSNFNPSVAGIGTHTITYTFTDGNGCENSATIVITVDGCVGVDKNELNKLTVSPNPASDYIEVRVDENNTINNIQLMSLEGKVVPVVFTTIDNQTTQIDVSSIAKGTYFIQLSSDKGQLTRKVIVQ